MTNLALLDVINGVLGSKTCPKVTLLKVHLHHLTADKQVFSHLNSVTLTSVVCLKTMP